MSLLEDLGFSPSERYVVVHVDDVGLCDAANEGFMLTSASAATCGSVMVPCPAFRAAAELARSHPELDLGVHLTLNCEYDDYRWKPLRDDVPGLCMPDGGMWHSTPETVQHADPDEVYLELRAQIERALDVGIDVTHLDAHMGTAFDLKFIQVYARLAREFRVPAFIPRIDRARLEALGMAPQLEPYLALSEQAERDGFPIFDFFDSDSLHFEIGKGPEHNRERLRRLGPGLSYLITHCARGGKELASITSDWEQRAEECRIYSDGTMSAVLADEGLRPIGMRPLRDYLRRHLAS